MTLPEPARRLWLLAYGHRAERRNAPAERCAKLEPMRALRRL